MLQFDLPKMKLFLKKIFIPLTIILISYLTLKSSFNLALFGDDWLAFSIYDQLLGPNSSSHWNHLTFFLSPYGSQQLMAFFRMMWGYDSTYYYMINFAFRMVAAFSFIPLVYYLTKDKFSAYFAVLFFAITVIGLDATNWVFNMTSYITIALFNLFLYLFIKHRDTNKLSDLLIGGLLYYIGYIIVPVRMHGSLPFIFLFELFWIFQNRNIKTVKKASLRFALILFIFLFIRFTGTSMGPPVEAAERLQIGLSTTLNLLGQGRTDFLFYPIIMFGTMFIPYFLNPFSIPVLSFKQMLIHLIAPSLLIFSVFLLFILSNSNKLRNKSSISLFIISFIWSILVIFLQKMNMNTLTSGDSIFSLLIGGYVFILIIWLIIKYRSNKLISTALFISLFWSILPFFFAWWWVPISIFPTTHRYLIVSAMGVSILLATIIAMGKDRQRKINLILGFSFILIIHIIATRMYLAQALISHGQETTKKIWSVISYIPAIGKNSRPIIFYFEGDGTNGGIIHDAITFGFPSHMSMLYNITESSKIPLVMDSGDEVLSAVKDGKSFKRQIGIVIDPIPIDNVFAYHLEGKDRLVDITDSVRRKLRENLHY